MGTYKSVLRIRRSVNLCRAETIVTMKFRFLLLITFWKDNATLNETELKRKYQLLPVFLFIISF